MGDLIRLWLLFRLEEKEVQSLTQVLSQPLV